MPKKAAEIYKRTCFFFFLYSQVGPGRGVAARGPLGRGPMQGRAGPPTAGPRGFSGPPGARLRNPKGNLPSKLTTICDRIEGRT